MVLVALILALASGFRLAPPPRALADAPPPATAHLHGARGSAAVTLRPGRAGLNAVEVRPMEADGHPLQPLELRIAFSRPEEELGPITVPLALDADGVWRGEGLPLPVPGPWGIRLDILITDFDQETLAATVEIAC